MKKLLLVLGLFFLGCRAISEFEPNGTSNQLSRILPSQISVVGEVFTATW